MQVRPGADDDRIDISIEVVTGPQRPAVLNARSLDAIGGIDTLFKTVSTRRAAANAAFLETSAQPAADPIRSVGGRIAIP